MAEGDVGQQRRVSMLANAVSNWISLALQIVAGLVLTPYIISNVGEARYGIWTVISTIVGYYGLLDLGIQSAVVRYVARYAGQGDYRSMNEVASTSLAIFVAGGITSPRRVWGLRVRWRISFGSQQTDREVFLAVIRITGISTAIGFRGHAPRTRDDRPRTIRDQEHRGGRGDTVEIGGDVPAAASRRRPGVACLGRARHKRPGGRRLLRSREAIPAFDALLSAAGLHKENRAGRFLRTVFLCRQDGRPAAVQPERCRHWQDDRHGGGWRLQHRVHALSLRDELGLCSAAA